MSDKNITISDVAEALGVSKTTVSRAISGKGRIGEETRQKVLSYIENQSKKEFDDNLSFSSLISNTISDLLHEVC